jgi:hypothetical protein
MTGRSDAEREGIAQIAAGLETIATHLATGGILFGPDRVDGRTQWGYGDDRVVGFAVAVEIAAALAVDGLNLLRLDRRYSAAALVRQLIECEYLVWLFGSDFEEARRWPNADGEQLRSMFTPSRVRQRSAGRFDPEEYQRHCGLGGHPSPGARALLPAHSVETPVEQQWKDLSLHLDRLWRTLMEAVRALDLVTYLPAGLVESVSEALERLPPSSGRPFLGSNS